MDDQVFHLVEQRADRQDASLEEIKSLIREHISKDEVYWRRIDIQDAQLTMLRRIILGVGAFFATLFSALWSWMQR